MTESLDLTARCERTEGEVGAAEAPEFEPDGLLPDGPAVATGVPLPLVALVVPPAENGCVESVSG